MGFVAVFFMYSQHIFLKNYQKTEYTKQDFLPLQTVFRAKSILSNYPVLQKSTEGQLIIKVK